MANPPERIGPMNPYCPFCGSRVYGLSTEDYVKICHGPGHHTIGWNGQMWLPVVREFCENYGLTKFEIASKEKSKREHEEYLANHVMNI